VEDEIRASVREQARSVLGHRKVVVAPPRDERVEALGLKPLDQVGTEETAAAGDEDVHGEPG
jgi:hypothetical protein